MRQAPKPPQPTHGRGRGSNQKAGVLAHACAACTRNEFAISGLTHALASLRRGAEALRDENVELRAELSYLRQQRSGA
jgi:hypothetical protein